MEATVVKYTFLTALLIPAEIKKSIHFLHRYRPYQPCRHQRIFLPFELPFQNLLQK